MKPTRYEPETRYGGMIAHPEGRFLLYADAEKWVTEKDRTISRFRSDLCDMRIKYMAALKLCNEITDRKDKEIAALINEGQEAARINNHNAEVASQEIAELQEWKRQALETEASWDPPQVAEELKIPWGGDIRRNILPKIKELKAEIVALTEWHEDIKRITKEISDFLHPDGGGPESPSLCDVQAYISRDIAALKEELKEKEDLWFELRSECFEVCSKNEKLLLFIKSIATEGQHDLGSNKLCDCVPCRIIQNAAKECI